MSLGTFSLAATTPEYLAAVERRAGTNSWLLLNLGASYERADVPKPGSGSEGARNVTANTTLQAVLGLRYVFVHSIVDVSLLGTVFGRYRNIESGLALLGAGTSEPGLKEYSGGVQAGVAAERSLTEGLAVRLQLQVASLALTKGTTRVVDAFGDSHDRDTYQTSFYLRASPTIGLYFYF